MKSLFVSMTALLCGMNLAFGQGTAFTYQGSLADAGQPANGAYDLRFTLYDSTNLPGTIIASPITNASTLISNGLFTVALDFGNVFPGAGRWLEIGVRTNGGSSFATLSPRQALTPTPYAITAAHLVSGGLTSGTYASPVTFNNPANQFTGSFAGNGSNLTNVNAFTLGGFAAGNFWNTGGNAGTVAAVNFLGTTDNQPLEFRVSGYRGLRLEPDPRGAQAGNFIGGFAGNTIQQPGSGSDVIVGGGYPGIPNIIQTNCQGVFIGGGSENQIGPSVNDAVIVGGLGNTNHAFDAVIAGGQYQFIGTNSTFSSIGGGYRNTIAPNCSWSAIGGGYGNIVDSGVYGATICGGGASFGVNHVSSTLSSIVGGSINTIQTNANDSAIVGGQANEIDSGAWGAFIGGGHSNWIQSATSPGDSYFNSSYSTISGGYGNTIQTNANVSTIGGGLFNTIQTNSPASTIAGGESNTILTNSQESIICGGFGNLITAPFASILGGFENAARGNSATVLGGDLNNASGVESIAAGQYAHASLDRTFVWSSFGSTASSFFPDRFAVMGTNGFSVDYYSQRSDGGGTRWVEIGPQFAGQTIGTWTGAYLSDGGAWVPNSDRNRKANFSVVDSSTVLEHVLGLPIQTWNYTNEPPSVRHLGPMAQDFHAVFGLNGTDDKHIADVDEGGVALAAVQGLNQKIEAERNAKNAEIEELKEKVARLEELVKRFTQTAPGESGR